VFTRNSFAGDYDMVVNRPANLGDFFSQMMLLTGGVSEIKGREIGEGHGVL